jgi:hypothetical protein
MFSRMNTLGFLVTTARDFRHYVFQASEFGRKIETSNGSYTFWEIGNGIELWVQTNLHKRIIGMNPHFHGSARVRAELLKSVSRPGQSVLDGAFYAWANPSANPSVAHPFVFDLPDYDTYTNLLLPTTTTVQLAAFAQELYAFPDITAFQAWLSTRQRNDKGKILERAWTNNTDCTQCLVVPHGLYTPSGKLTAHPPAQLVLRGHIQQTLYRTNPVTRQKFYWALINALGYEFDMVADPQIVQGTLIDGGFIHGLFRLSGRLHLL